MSEEQGDPAPAVAPTTPAAPTLATIPEPVLGAVANETSRRLFVGVRISVATANSIAAAAQTLARRAREANVDLKWVVPASYHVTLKFLGQTRNSAIDAIGDALTRACEGMSTMKVTCARIGAFPSGDAARVIWAGVTEVSGALAALAARVEAACVDLGFAPEIRTFHPHVTIARARESRPLTSVVLPMAEQMFGDTRIDGIVLFESKTDSKGSMYREVRRIDFKQAGSTPEIASERQSGALQPGTPSREPVEIETDDGWPRGRPTE